MTLKLHTSGIQLTPESWSGQPRKHKGFRTRSRLMFFSIDLFCLFCFLKFGAWLMDSHKSKGEMNCQTSTHDLWAVVLYRIPKEIPAFFLFSVHSPKEDLNGMAVTCDHRIPVTCDHKQKNRIWVTCDHKVRSLTTTKRHIR